MAEATPRELLVRDPLSDVTRKERRLLLLVSLIGIAFVKTGLYPTKISALGIECSQADQRAMTLVLCFVVLYFLVAFFLYAVSDFLAWRLEYIAAMKKVYEERRKTIEEKRKEKRKIDRSMIEEMQDNLYQQQTEDAFRQLVSRNRFVIRSVGPTAILRALLEFLFPIVIGVYASVVLWLAKAPTAIT